MIRSAIKEDAASIAKIIVEAWKVGFIGIVEESYACCLEETKYAKIFESKIENNGELILVYELENIVVGFAVGHSNCSDFDSELDALYVSPMYQGKGIGRMLLEAVQSRYKERSCLNMVAWTLKGAKNNEFYENSNGVPVGEKEYELGGSSYVGIGYEFKL